MRLPLTLTIVALFTVSGCGNSKSPWARKMPKAERVAWPTKCGITADLVKVQDGEGDYANTSYMGQLTPEPPATTLIACDLSWNRDKDRLANLRVHIARFEPVLTSTDVEPLLTLALAELRPADQAVARRVASGEFTRASTSGLEFSGGFRSGQRTWELFIRAK